MSAARTLLERIVADLEATNTAFMADYEKAGEGFSVRMSGETAAMLVAERAQLVDAIRLAVAALPPEPKPDAVVREDERTKIAWWLEAGCNGPAAISTPEPVLKALRELVVVLREHPERWHGAPGILDRPADKEVS